MKNFRFILFFLLSYHIFSAPFQKVFASLGVGVGTGKIVVDEKLKSGVIYNLPPLSVINTGNEASNYGVGVSFKETDGKIKPSEDWFLFEPKEFYLNPGESKLVSVKLQIPLKSEPGDYFCFLEGHPIIKGESGQTQIGIAAASKLFFSIAPSNYFEAFYYRTISLWKEYQPWSNILSGSVFIFILIGTLSRFVNININFKKKVKKTDKKDDEKDNG